MSIALIWAQASNGCIGRDGDLPWHLPEDLKHFKATTMGGTVVMGRRTYASLPAAVRPLPGRDTVVLTSRALDEPGVRTYGSVADLLDAHRDADDDLWVAGGAQVYAALEPHAHRAIVTEIDARFDGDVHAPVLGPEWRAADVGEWAVSEASGLRYRIVEHVRRAA
ncbi:MAG TPA: dihydrofolate reductase [Mycobacteriales bacterium]|nr:dihydrofolate reductase [Mycobacteriales bacterium]